MPGSKPHHAALRLSAMLAIVVLALGLPRLLRTCDHGDHTHFVVAFGHCDHAHSHEGAHTEGEVRSDGVQATGSQGDGEEDGDERAPRERHDERPVVDSDGAFDCSTPPRPYEVPLAIDGVAWPLMPWWLPEGTCRPRATPPATGPPRTDQLTALRRTTRLQV